MATIKIDDVSEEITVGSIFCLGRNYRAHAEEMGAVVTEEPLVFLKPSSALATENDSLKLPRFSREVHHEVEMVVLIGMEGKDIPVEEAMNYVCAYGVGMDLTARDRQTEAKKKGLPWTISKGFDGSAPVSRFVRAARIKDPHQLDLYLKVNGILRQKSHTSKMIHGVPAIITYLSSIFTLSNGDLVFTGTPEGVGPLSPGDSLEIGLGDKIQATFRVEAL